LSKVKVLQFLSLDFSRRKKDSKKGIEQVCIEGKKGVGLSVPFGRFCVPLGEGSHIITDKPLFFFFFL
jgi:hypothetical protein